MGGGEPGETVGRGPVPRRTVAGRTVAGRTVAGRTVARRTVARRTVLQGAVGTGALAALGLATACSRRTAADRGSASPTAGTTPVGSGSPGPSATGSPAAVPSSTRSGPDWESLRRRLSGRLMLPSDAGYEVARLSSNPRFDEVRPAAVALCVTPQDAAAALTFARDGEVPFSVRSGGHSYPGWSTGTGLVIDTSGLDDVRPDPQARTLRVGAGARLVDIYTRAAAVGLGIPAGSCPSVAAAGLTLGGGVGVMTRLWGLTCDRVTSVDLVTADGTLRTADADRDPELFWASRGGGGGSFGIVTAFTYAASAAPDLSLVVLTWPWTAAPDVVAAWQDRAPGLDRRLWTTCKLLVRDGRPHVLVAGVWAGPRTGLDAAIAPLLSAVGTAPASRSVGRHGFGAAMLLEAGCRGGDACRLPPVGTLPREPLAATSHVPAEPLAAQGIATLVGAVDDLAADGALRAAGLVETGVSLDALGGAVADVAPTATAFWHRTAPFTMQYTATWTASAAQTTAPAGTPLPSLSASSAAEAATSGPPTPGQPFLDTVRALREAMDPYAGRTAYVNYADSAVVEWDLAYWGENRWRLGRIKNRTDPDGVFTFPQAVHPQPAT